MKQNKEIMQSKYGVFWRSMEKSGEFPILKMMSIICAILLIIATQSMCVALASDELVPFTPVMDAINRRAVCMDGSPSGYHYVAGSGDGAGSWLVVLMGGGWCPNNAACQANRTSGLGSTVGAPTANFSGMLSGQRDVNPDFYNWNRVYVVYCDQSSFLGDSESDSTGPKLQFRGSKIFDAVVEDLVAKGMQDADNAILAGRSAGGLSAIIHCDGFRALLPDVDRVKCFSDSGFFIRAKNLPNADYREQFFASTILFHNISNFLPTTCTQRIFPSLCLFPEYLVGDVKTPLFLLNSAFDYYQVLYKLVPPNSVDWEAWKTCVNNLTNCRDAQDLIQDFGAAFLQAIRELPSDLSRGLFVHDCFNHVVAFKDEHWSRNSTLKLGSLTISEAFSNWFFDRDAATLITSSGTQIYC